MTTEKSQSKTADYLAASQLILKKITAQEKLIQQAADWFSDTILAGRMVHLFGSGHSRMMVEEFWPRYGSFPGFNPIVELSMSFHNLVIGANGIRQAMFIENVTGLAATILRNFDIDDADCAMIVSTSGTNIVPVEMAEIFQKRGIKVVAMLSSEHSQSSPSKRDDGKKLGDFADLVLDNGAPAGDAMVFIEGMEQRVAPGSTVGGALMVNCLKAEVAQRLAAAGHPPLALASAGAVGTERANEIFNAAYDEHAHRIARCYGKIGIPSYVSKGEA